MNEPVDSKVAAVGAHETETVCENVTATVRATVIVIVPVTGNVTGAVKRVCGSVNVVMTLKMSMKVETTTVCGHGHHDADTNEIRNA